MQGRVRPSCNSLIQKAHPYRAMETWEGSVSWRTDPPDEFASKINAIIIDPQRPSGLLRVGGFRSTTACTSRPWYFCPFVSGRRVVHDKEPALSGVWLDCRFQAITLLGAG